jgi:hypothetical protein
MGLALGGMLCGAHLATPVRAACDCWLAPVPPWVPGQTRARRATARTDIPRTYLATPVRAACGCWLAPVPPCVPGQTRARRGHTWPHPCAPLVAAGSRPSRRAPGHTRARRLRLLARPRPTPRTWPDPCAPCDGTHGHTSDIPGHTRAPRPWPHQCAPPLGHTWPHPCAQSLATPVRAVRPNPRTRPLGARRPLYLATPVRRPCAPSGGNALRRRVTTPPAPRPR